MTKVEAGEDGVCGIKVPLDDGVICNLLPAPPLLKATIASKWGRNLSINWGLAPDTVKFRFFNSDLSSLTFMSSILLSIFWARAVSCNVGGLLRLNVVQVTAAGLQGAAPNVNLSGVWALDELVGLGLELALLVPGAQLLLEELVDDEGAGNNMGYLFWFSTCHWSSRVCCFNSSS